MSASAVAVQFAITPNFSHLAFGDDSAVDEALYYVLNVRKRKDPDHSIVRTIAEQYGCKTVGDLRKLTEHDWKTLNIPALCRIYLKHIVRQSKRKEAGPKTFLDILQDDFNFGQPFDMSQYQTHVATLTAMGFSQDEAMEALVVTENKGIESALEILFQQDKSVRATRRAEAMGRLGRQAVKGKIAEGKDENVVDLTSIKKTLDTERSRRQKLELELHVEREGSRKFFYREYLRGLISQDSISVNALERLREYRKDYNLSEDDHAQVLSQLGYSVDKFDKLKNYEARDKGSECVVCLDKPKSHVVIKCMHLAFCEDCAEKAKKAKDRKCPICSEKIVDISRIYL